MGKAAQDAALARLEERRAAVQQSIDAHWDLSVQAILGKLGAHQTASFRIAAGSFYDPYILMRLGASTLKMYLPCLLIFCEALFSALTAFMCMCISCAKSHA